VRARLRPGAPGLTGVAATTRREPPAGQSTPVATAGRDGLGGLVLFSDGLQSLALNLASASPFAPFFAPFLQALADPFDSDATSAGLAAFLDSARVCARTDDDKTLLAAGLAERA
jgi:hypothetical protein